MKVITVVECTESEIVKLISEHLNNNFDSIIAYQELGNEKWVVDVSEASDYDHEVVKSGKLKYYVSSYLNVLCSKGLIPSGKYIIDCTW